MFSHFHLRDDPVRQGTNAVGDMLGRKLELIVNEPRLEYLNN